MRLKSFQAKTMGDAMRQVKETLGDDAIIVSTREENGFVRITAAVEQQEISSEPPAKGPRFERPREKAPEPVPTPAEEEDALEIITDVLLRHRVPASVSDKIITTAMTLRAGTAKSLLTRAIDQVFGFSLLQEPKQPKPIILVGPPGAGKTLMTAKLAARYVMDGQKTAVITTDIARAGGIEQLQAFLNILSLPLYQAEEAKDLKHALAQAAGAKHIIVDTGGLNPFDPQEMKILARLMAVTEMEAALVLPSGIDAEEAAEMAQTFSILGVKKFIPTRLDFARRLGGVLSAADKAGLSLTAASHTAQVAEGVIDLDAATLADFLMPDAQTKRGK